MSQTLTPVNASPGSGIAPVVFTTVTDTSLKFKNDGNIIALFQNANAATRTLTQLTHKTIQGLTISDPTVSLAGFVDGTDPAVDVYGYSIVGPLAPDLYNDPTTGLAELTVSATAGVAVALIRVG